MIPIETFFVNTFLEKIKKMEKTWYNGFMNNENILAKNLRKTRKGKGYTQAQLAEISGVTRKVIVHYENYVKKPVFENIRKIADALDISMDELTGKTESKKPKKQEDLSFSIMKKVRIIEKFPTRDQNVVFSLIKSLAEKNKIRGKL